MLTNLLTQFTFKKHVKSGLYVDYILRLVAKTSLYNIFIWGGLYLSEKFFIEYLTRFTTNKYSTSTYSYTSTINVMLTTLK